MNKIYRVVWNKSTQTWTAVSEYATAQGKSSSRSVVTGSEVKSTKGIRFIYTALASATLMLVSGQAWGAEIKDGSATGAVVVHTGGSSTSVAQGKDSTAIGTNAKVIGEDGEGKPGQSSIAFGSNATVTNAKNAIAFGTGAKADFNNAIAVGNAAHAAKQSDLAIGDGAKALNAQDTAIGVGATAQGNGSSAFGYQTKATGYLSTALGNQAQAKSNSSIAVGKSIAEGLNSIAVGNDTTTNTNNTIAIGNTAKVSGTTPISNTSSVMSGISGIAIGNNSEVKNRNYGIAIGDNAFVGTYDQTRNTGTTQNPVIHYDSARGDQSDNAGRPGVAIGWKTQATGDDSIALGNDSISTGRSSVSLGKAAYAEDTDAIAIGNSARAGQAKASSPTNRHNSTAIGSYAQAIGGWNTALGTRAYANNDRALAVGSLASAEGQNTTAVGSYSFVESDGGSALGYHAIVTKNAGSGTALGVGTVVDGKRSGGLSAAVSGNPTTFVNDGRSYIGGEDNYAIGNKNVVGGKTKNSVALGNNIKLGATAATLTSTHLDGKDNTIAPRTESVTYTNEKALENAIAIGNESSVASHQGIAIGKRANVTEKGLQATAIGGGNYRPDEIASNGAIAVGDSATARGTGSVAVGLNSQTIFMNSSAVGNEANAAGYNSSAFGYQSLANGVSSIAIGDKALAGAQHKDTHVPIANRAIAIGVNSNATGETAVALGSNTDVKKSRGTALGVLSQVVHHDGVALGAYSIANRYQKDEGADPLTAKGFALYTEEEIKNDTEKAKKNAVWKATHAAVSVGNDTPQSQAARQGNSTTIGTFDIPLVTRQITGVAAGSQDTDAVNVAQLKAAGFVLATTADTQAGGIKTTSNTTNTDDKIINGETLTLKAGQGVAINQDGSEVTISTQQQPVVYTNANGDKLYKHTDGKFYTQPNGGGQQIDPPNVIASMQNADGTTTAPTTLANVADGDVTSTSKDAVNGSQLFAQGAGVKNIIGGNTTYDPADGTYKNADIGGTGKATIDEAIKASKTEVAEGKNVTVTTKTGTNGQTIYTVATKDDVSFNKVTTGTGPNQVVLDNTGVNVGGNTYISDAGLNANNKKVTNVANGAITADSKDAVNGGQLRNTAGDIATIIGGNAKVDDAGNVTASDIGGTGKATIDEAIKASKTTVSSNDRSIKVTKTTDQTTGADNYDISVNAQGLAESAQLPVVYTKKDGTKVYKVGDKFFDNKAGTGTEVPAADIIASMQNADGTTTAPTTLANVADGDVTSTSKDAVNGSQLFAQGAGVKNIIGGNTTYDPADGTYKNADIGGTGKATIDEAIKASKTEVAEGKNVTVTTKTGTNGQTIYTVATKDDVSFNKVTTGTGPNQVVLDNTGVNVGGNTYISDAGLNANNKKVTNVANGAITADSKDAVNGGQLYDTHQAIGQLANQTVNLGNQLNNRIGDVEDKANAGVSSAMAMASLPQAYIPGKSMLTGGLATYNGEGAVAVGLSKLSDNGRWVLKMSGSADTKGNAGASIGAGFHF